MECLRRLSSALLLIWCYTSLTTGQPSEPFEPVGTSCSIEGNIRLFHLSCHSNQTGVLQVCDNIGLTEGRKIRWRYISTINWSPQATKVACQQLGHRARTVETEWSTALLTERVDTRVLRAGVCSQVIQTCVRSRSYPNVNEVVGISCGLPANSPTTEFPSTIQVQTTDHTTSQSETSTPIDNCTCPTNNPTSTSDQQKTPFADGQNTVTLYQQSISSALLSVLVVALALVLLVVSTGWIVSCVYFRKTLNSGKFTVPSVSDGEASIQRHLRNPLYNGNLVPLGEYSSSEETYATLNPHSYDEVTDVSRDKGDGSHEYNVLELNTINVNAESHYHELEHGPGQSSHDSHVAGDYEVPTNGVADKQYSTLHH